jgi:multidrug resistance efflux pump
MSTELGYRDEDAELLQKLEQLRRFTGAPAAFWQACLEAMMGLAKAKCGVIARKAGETGPAWRRVAANPSDSLGDPAFREFWTRVENLVAAAADAGQAKLVWHGPKGEEAAVALRLETDRESESWVAAFYLPGANQAKVDAALRQLQLSVYLPAHYQLQRGALRFQAGENAAASVLDLLAGLNRAERFVEGGMALCNELAARFRCDRVSFGWEERGYVRMRAVSHSDNLKRKMEASQALEAAMEEAVDQEEPVVWPSNAGDGLITRDHARYADEAGGKHLCSVPVRINDRPVGALTCERESEAFDDEDARALLIAADLAAPRLHELWNRDRWFGARWAASARKRLAKLLGPEKTWAKATAILVAVALGILFFGKATYRVEAPFTLKAESVQFISAPFQGFIAEVRAEPGLAFETGEPLLLLDTRDLLLEEAAALADYDRFAREEEKARAEGALAQMRIAEAQAEQSRVRLELVRHRLSQAAITAPFDGFVVEGDLKQRLGAPVRQGDVLFRLSRLDASYFEARVSERDIHEIQLGAEGEIAFASQPKLKFPIRVSLIEPIAVPQEKGNVFVVRCELLNPQEDWWRPGMTGLVKVDAGKRTFFWIFFHRTIDFLRLLLWW